MLFEVEKRETIEMTADNDGNGSRLSRRKFVAGSAAAWASVMAAGCSALSPSEETDTAAPTPTDIPTDTPKDTPTETGTPEPQPENFVVTDEVITGAGYVPPGYDGFVTSCAPSRTFVPGMQPVFKIGIFDPATGDILTNDTLDSVAVNIDGGPSVEAAWAGDDEEHPAEEWSASWVIPEETQPGPLTYTVEVSGGSEDANFRDVGILKNSITVIEYNDPRNYIVTDELYAGSAGVPEDNPFVTGCMPQRQFAPGMMVGFDIGIYEGRTGNPVGPPDFEMEGVVQGVESATLTIEGQGVTKELVWQGTEGEHRERGEDLFWNCVWHIPQDVEPGTYSYTVDVKSSVSTSVVGALANEFTIVDA